jgi:hypothetical protein
LIRGYVRVSRRAGHVAEEVAEVVLHVIGLAARVGSAGIGAVSEHTALKLMLRDECMLI